MNNRFNLRTAKFKVLGILLLLSSGVLAQSPDSWRLLIEPSFMRPQVWQPVPQAEHTVFAAAYLHNSELTYFTRSEFSALNVDFDQFRKRALQNATDRKLKAELVRDKNKVVQSAYLHSDNPLTATAVLAPEFYKQFVPVFGPDFLVAIPSRFSVYVFPALASKYRDYAGAVLREYRESAFPVSVEVFKVNEQGLQAIGTFESKPE